jgi:hypothetical protein
MEMTPTERKIVNAAISLAITIGLFLQFSYEVIIGMDIPIGFTREEYIAYLSFSLVVFTSVILFLKLSAGRGSLIALLSISLIFLYLWYLAIVGLVGLVQSVPLLYVTASIGFATNLILVVYALYRIIGDLINSHSSSSSSKNSSLTGNAS